MLTLEDLIENKLIIQNDFFIKYQSLIIKNKNTKKEKFRTQIHHIIPKAAFKILSQEVDDSISNTVNLSYYDHVLAHYYLANCSLGYFRYANTLALKHVIGSKYSNLNEDDLKKELPLLNTLYEQAMEIQSIKTHNNKKGKNFTEEHKRKLSLANKGRIYVHTVECEKIIKPEDLEKYKALGFILGRKHRHSKETKALMSAHMKGIKKATPYTKKLVSDRVKGSR